MSARGMVRATERGFVCVDCGRVLEQHEALACEACDRADMDALRALLAPEPEPVSRASLARAFFEVFIRRDHARRFHGRWTP